MDRYYPLRLMLSLALVGGAASVLIWSFLGFSKWALPLVFVAGSTAAFCATLLAIGLVLIHLDKRARRSQRCLVGLANKAETKIASSVQHQ